MLIYSDLVRPYIGEFEFIRLSDVQFLEIKFGKFLPDGYTSTNLKLTVSYQLQTNRFVLDLLFEGVKDIQLSRLENGILSLQEPYIKDISSWQREGIKFEFGCENGGLGFQFLKGSIVGCSVLEDDARRLLWKLTE